MHSIFALTIVRLALAAIALGTLAACAGGDAPTQAKQDGRGTPAGADLRPRGKAAVDGMVAAVSATGKPGAPVELKFDIAARPELGQPLEVAVAVVPRSADVGQLRVVFQSNEAVEVQSGNEAVQDKPVDGVAMTHTVTVVPRREGVFYLGAVALIEGPGGSVARSFAIPIIVGDPVAAERALAAKPAQGTVSKSAGGEDVVSLPASAAP
ncbi:MAG: hypothetical protein IT481_10830 [Gammaproteobacteria bacterium]|nr:hypothetical protein [Gammaproteobacteria bacterium]